MEIGGEVDEPIREAKQSQHSQNVQKMSPYIEIQPLSKSMHEEHTKMQLD